MLSAKYLLTLLLGSGKVGTVDAPREQMTPIDFEVTWFKVKDKVLVFEKNVFCSKSPNPFG